MSLGDVPKVEIDLGVYVRPDGQRFVGQAVLFEFPDAFDYWQAVYDMSHAEWGHMRFVLTIPKNIALSADHAQQIVRGAAYLQIQQALHLATTDGRPLNIVWAWDGWTLL